MQQISASQPIKEIDSMERKSSNFREVRGSDDNTNKFADKEEYEFSSDNDIIHDMGISSETDQQEYLIDISNEEEQVKDVQDDFKDTFLRNTGVSLFYPIYVDWICLRTVCLQEKLNQYIPLDLIRMYGSS